MASDFFIKIDTIEGSSIQANHENEIEMLNFQFNVNNAGTFHNNGTGGGKGKASVSDLSFMKRVDKSSPLLFKAAANSTHIPSAVITTQAGAGDNTTVSYYKITLTDVLVSNFSNSGGTGDDNIMESVSLNFGKIDFAYTGQANDGTNAAAVTGWFSPATNTAG